MEKTNGDSKAAPGVQTSVPALDDAQGSGQYYCPRCDSSVPAKEQTEHLDWHYAADLQAREEGQEPVQDATSQLGQLDINRKSDGHVAKNPSSAPPVQPPQQGPASTSMSFAPPAHPPPSRGVSTSNHTNKVIEAGRIRARDEQQMQNALQNLQYQYRIYNSEIEPEHDTDYYCSCPIHQYQAMKWARVNVQRMWSEAVMYPGEKAYTDMAQFVSNNPYRFRVMSPYGYGIMRQRGYVSVPQPGSHATYIRQTIALNNKLNVEAQAKIDAKEPQVDIWKEGAPLTPQTTEKPPGYSKEGLPEKPTHLSADVIPADGNAAGSKRTGFKKVFHRISSEGRSEARTDKAIETGRTLRDQILAEENGRWPDEYWRDIVNNYQDKVGMRSKIAQLREHSPIQYLHLLRAGYFEPIPVAWANQASNPLKFNIEAGAGWRGITPAWRGYEDTAEERLYWVLNHRDGSVGARLKPDFISAMDMARQRMATAVEPPPQYYSATDTCFTQHTTEGGYSRQVMPRPFQAYDAPESPNDDTMILLDVSGSMDFDPVRPIYNQYLVTSYTGSSQPKNKHIAKAILGRFTDAMANHDRQFGGYDLVTFSSKAHYLGKINHQSLESTWRRVQFGGGTRVMTGWQMVKDLHFQKHSASATHHPTYGWQAGPETPILRLLLFLDGEATDMDEFELDLLGLSWAHVTIFLVGVDGCPHHHRHANELQRISDVNHHVSFVDAQGNMPERFVTHELLKRHLGYELSMSEFEQLEELPEYRP